MTSRRHHITTTDVLSLMCSMMVRVCVQMNRWRTNIMLLCLIILAIYMLIFDPAVQGYIPLGAIDMEELEQELEIGNPVRLVTYKSPINDKIYAIPVKNKSHYTRDYASFESHLSRTLKYHRLWTWADKAISKDALFPESGNVDEVIKALQTAKFVNVDVLDIGKYESGTSEKWVVTLEGGQKAMMKIVWEDKGSMKGGALCNYGYEIPTAEIAAFHLHRILGFRNTPYVTGRQVDLQLDILPVASPTVMKQITVTTGNETCVEGKCFFCKAKTKICPPGGIIEVSMAYWIPRKLSLHTYPPQYMPYSTPSMEEWGPIPFNNRTYCDKTRKIAEPYEQDQYYYDLFDFAVLDTLMYHFDTKHYTLDDKSEASGLTVRLDHGRAFCAYDRDDEQIFLAPITQCCTLRKSTWEKLKANKDGTLTRKLRRQLEMDAIAPVLEESWYPALERRLDLIIHMMERCARANGGWDNVLVDD